MVRFKFGIQAPDFEFHSQYQHDRLLAALCDTILSKKAILRECCITIAAEKTHEPADVVVEQQYLHGLAKLSRTLGEMPLLQHAQIWPTRDSDFDFYVRAASLIVRGARHMGELLIDFNARLGYSDSGPVDSAALHVLAAAMEHHPSLESVTLQSLHTEGDDTFENALLSLPNLRKLTFFRDRVGSYQLIVHNFCLLSWQSRACGN